MKEGSLYFHIPYCKQACHYCDFHFSTSLKTKDNVLQKMREELATHATRDPWRSMVLRSIYFGGGTPSLLQHQELVKLLHATTELFSIQNQPEITLEANPDDITAEKAEQWLKMGINRLSIGLQSTHDNELQLMNRAHTSHMGREAILAAKQAGFENISIDLIYGMPTGSLQTWLETLYEIEKLEVKHISAYALTIEHKTALHYMVKEQKIKPLDDETVLSQFEYLRQWANKMGFEHYELSNFAQPNFRSTHNSHYWSQNPYLGIGPGAHSFDGETRFWNISNNTNYARGVPPTFEKLTSRDKLNENLMTRLRTAEGFDWLKHTPATASKADLDQLKELIRASVNKRELFPLPNGFRINPELWMQSDRIISNLFITD